MTNILEIPININEKAQVLSNKEYDNIIETYKEGVENNLVQEGYNYFFIKNKKLILKSVDNIKTNKVKKVIFIDLQKEFEIIEQIISSYYDKDSYINNDKYYIFTDSYPKYFCSILNEEIITDKIRQKKLGLGPIFLDYDYDNINKEIKLKSYELTRLDYDNYLFLKKMNMLIKILILWTINKINLIYDIKIKTCSLQFNIIQFYRNQTYELHTDGDDNYILFIYPSSNPISTVIINNDKCISEYLMKYYIENEKGTEIEKLLTMTDLEKRKTINDLSINDYKFKKILEDTTTCELFKINQCDSILFDNYKNYHATPNKQLMNKDDKGLVKFIRLCIYDVNK